MESNPINSLSQLKAAGTVVVTDTGEFETISKFRPQDATTNPSLILAAANKPEYADLIDTAVQYALKNAYGTENQTQLAVDRLLVEFGKKIMDIIPGRVSTEVDARLSFDKKATIKKALEIIDLYEEQGVDRDRVLIKIAATWEGIQAALELEQVYDIHCNLTLIFSFVQAVACAEAQVTLISPFVGRILDWYKAKTGKQYEGAADPGVISVVRIFKYFKAYGYKTIVMGASFRNVSEIKALAGCDYLTIAPTLLDQLQSSTDAVPKVLDPATSAAEEQEPFVSFVSNETAFRFELNEDQMATEKLSEGVRKFSADCNTLFDLLREKVKVAQEEVNNISNGVPSLFRRVLSKL
ncbi:Transaldolase [Komagataella phaffii]|uniref:Transaldolase n=2 Tax=Komagataella phaffii TaxID=460519 RepID=C4R244_KOMPG|nr:Transaldolase, enzyme in the non-oxidative pentose phosphate pathway [Komagataella phaffii GS115]AOA62903.1 GQ67_00990T0 [Komagataella phaffii]AOA67515.1 GQ68_00399T0 [Komagataella phaffii GS115]CAY69568.1 Transaldolase, enzyme in the non-oxidative pentose phosphate pathway [Komagataella phaffii GS115]